MVWTQNGFDSHQVPKIREIMLLRKEIFFSWTVKFEGRNLVTFRKQMFSPQLNVWSGSDMDIQRQVRLPKRNIYKIRYQYFILSDSPMPPHKGEQRGPSIQKLLLHQDRSGYSLRKDRVVTHWGCGPFRHAPAATWTGKTWSLLHFGFCLNMQWPIFYMIISMELHIFKVIAVLTNYVVNFNMTYVKIRD